MDSFNVTIINKRDSLSILFIQYAKIEVTLTKVGVKDE